MMKGPMQRRRQKNKKGGIIPNIEEREKRPKVNTEKYVYMRTIQKQSINIK